MITVYVVTEGSNSDHEIVGLFSEESAASQWVKEWGGDVEECELDGLVPHLGQLVWTVRMVHAGDVLSVGCGNVSLPCEAEVRYQRVRSWGGVFRYVMFVSCFADDEQHAIKIANEKRTQLIASGEWKGNALEQPTVVA